MVVIWGNILSFIGNVVALAVEVLVFNAFFPRNEDRKSQWLCILLWWAIATFLSISVGTKFGYTFKMLQEVALIYLFCAFLYQSRWDRRLFIVVTVYSLLFSYGHWFDELCIHISGFTYEEYIWNVPLYSIFFFLRCSFILAFALGQFTRDYTQTVKRAADNKRRYAPGEGCIPPVLLSGVSKGVPPLAHDFACKV